MRTSRFSWQDVALFVVMICTLAMTALTIARQFADPPPAAGFAIQPPLKLENFDEVVDGGHRIGPDSAPVTVVVFGDFECPACGAFVNSTYPTVSGHHPGRSCAEVCVESETMLG